MKALLLLFIGLLPGNQGIDNKEPEKALVFSSNSELPQVPFQLYHPAYNKTVYVVASCAETNNSVTLLLGVGEESGVAKKVFYAASRAFDIPGITRVQICRKEENK